jgi:chromo domain-containing protein 1
MGDGDYQNAGGINRDQTMSGLQNTESPTEISAQPPNTPQSDLSRPKHKIGMKDYQRKKALEVLGSRAKEVIFGSDETKSLLMDFGEITASAQPSWVDIFSKQAKITFDQMCIANQFQAQQGFLQRRKLAMGNLTLAENDIETLKALDKIVDELVLRSAGLMAKLDGFAILVFPAKKEEWKFLESDAGRYAEHLFFSGTFSRSSFKDSYCPFTIY